MRHGTVERALSWLLVCSRRGAVADRRELLDYTHALAHYINRGLLAQWAGQREGAQHTLSFAVHNDRLWRVVSDTSSWTSGATRTSPTSSGGV